MPSLRIGLALMAVLLALLLAPAASIALELPDVQVLSEETYPATGTGSVSGVEAGKLETELGEKLTSSGVKVEVELAKLSSLGSDKLTLSGTFEPKGKTECNTLGQAKGTVELEGEYHVVDTSTSPLTVAILSLFKELVMECGKVKVKIRSPAVVKLNKVTSGTDVTEFGLVLVCTGKGKQELKTYLNDENVSTKAVLTANFGLGFETICENVSSELVVKSTKMVDFLF
jgi:hypothetical protein